MEKMTQPPASESAEMSESNITNKKQRASYLTVSQAYDLDVAVAPVTKALWPLGHYGIFQVGSSLLRGDWRDVDLRCIMEDEKFDALFGKKFSPTHLFLNTAISEWIGARCGLPIDFQFQQVAGHGISLLKARDHQCRWPLDSRGPDGMPRCCGGRRASATTSYCAEHEAIACPATQKTERSSWKQSSKYSLVS